MAQEQIKCNTCKTKYSITWDEDDVVDFVEAEYCPFCGELAEDYEEDLLYQDDDYMYE